MDRKTPDSELEKEQPRLVHKRPAPDEGEEEYQPVVVNEEVGPEVSKKKLLEKDEDDYELEVLPCAEMYERSYQHKDLLQVVYISLQTDTLITVSMDGFIKFWRKIFHGINFLRAFHAHPGKCTGTTLSWNGRFFASVSTSDKGLKHFDVTNADMINMHKLGFEPGVCEFIYKLNETKPVIAVAEIQTNHIRILQLDVTPTLIKTIDFHLAPLRLIRFNPLNEIAVSIDTKGVVEYWDSNTYEFPSNKVTFKYKLDTDYLELAKNKTVVLSATLSHNGELIALYAKDRIIRVYVFATGKLYRKFTETLEKYAEWQSDKKDTIMSLDKIEYERRFATEREIDKNIESISPPNIQFSESDNFILWTSYLGVKVVNLDKGELAMLLGKMETNERFLNMALYQGSPKKNPSTSALASREEQDPILVCTAYKKNRFYLFSRREPEEHRAKKATSRDILNEQPTQEALQLAHSAVKSLPTQVLLVKQ